MFENDITIYGNHATKLKYLKEELNIFPRYYDVYMAGAIVGSLNGKISKKDNESTDRARIYADVLIRETAKSKKIFQTVILCDEIKGWTSDEKLNICFRYKDRNDDESPLSFPEEDKGLMQEAMELFESYALAGIEILYNDFTNEKTTLSVDEIINKEYEIAKNQKIEIESKDSQYEDSQLLKEEF